MITKTKENIIEEIYYWVGTGANAIEFNVCSGDNGELELVCDNNIGGLSRFTLKNAFEVLENIKSIYIKCSLSDDKLEDQLMGLIKKYPKLRSRVIII